MARIRGVTASDRGAHASLAAAVLGRDSAARAEVTGLLVRRRDDAAAALAFEVAARITDEIAALEWITCEQRVTVPGGGDAVVHGWHDGVLVRLEVHDGRLDRWVQKACSESVAAPLLSATPERWAALAADAAELARALLGAAGRQAYPPPGDPGGPSLSC